jgi:hypothetical protein
VPEESVTSKRSSPGYREMVSRCVRGKTHWLSESHFEAFPSPGSKMKWTSPLSWSATSRQRAAPPRCSRQEIRL